MAGLTFVLDPHRLPRPADESALQRNLGTWREAAAEWTDRALAAFAEHCVADPAAGTLLAAVFGNSPHLSEALIREPSVLRTLFERGPDVGFAELLAQLTAEASRSRDLGVLMTQLRVAKRRAGLLIGLADLSGAWPLEKVTWALSDIADTTISLATSHLLRAGHESGQIVLPHAEQPQSESGLVVLGMGKLGAGELNYSSDVDLIVFYDDEKVDYRGRRSVQEFFAALVRDLVRILEERTVDGYVFRTDLRLRPDPGSMPAAISLLAAEAYYEGFGQNWERAAMIKARPVAGDLAAGRAFIDFLKPFIWRKHLDFAAIQDIHSIKRQINAHRGGSRIAVAGHNVKLGRGGIREIEFFAQTQQLIWGGRERELRKSGTCEALDALAAAGHVDQRVADELKEAYGFLRSLEHRLQMIDDKQTQTLPDDPAKLRHLAVFFGFADTEAFAAALTAVMQTVETHYAGLFEDAPPLAPRGNLVFTGGESDPDTLRTLAAMGYSDPEAVCHEVRGWHHGRVRATRSTRARELLTELIPTLLESFARTADPNAAFHRFDHFLSTLPAGVPLFSLFANNPSLLNLVAEIMGDAPRLAEWLSVNPTLLDSVLTADFFDPLDDRQALAAELGDTLDQAVNAEEMLDLARRWVNEQKFRIGVQTLRGLLDTQQVGHHLSDLADATLLALHPRVEAEFAAAHGRLPGAGMGIVALGKMGSREMTAKSDLDLIFVYDLVHDVEASDGAKPLAPSAYYARLTQRVINALTAKTNEGTLYEVDMRLRPSGNAGPIATSLVSFAQYHAGQAWTWEHMALTRARVVTGSAVMRGAIKDVIGDTLRRPRDPAKLVVDVADMRERMAREHKAESPWEVKHRRGGLVDIEFIAQYLALRWGHDHPSILEPSTAAVLAEAARLHLLDAADAEILEDGLALWSAIQQILRQTIEGGFREETAPGRLKDILVRATATPHFEGLKITMAQRAEQVMAVYRRLIDEPAQPLRAALAKKES
jgi:[glutamine synthetase] adenylyltransferase / [glutamine synthetase]-adenylyl-L-tyrosine phosphorylase